MRISELVFPRPTVLITTCSRDGRPNVAAFSFFMPISYEPTYLAFAIAERRHSFKNLREVGEFVVNIPDESMLDKVWVCGTKSGAVEDKFSSAQLTAVESVKVRPPRIKECPVQLECVVEYMEEYGDHYLVVGRVVEEHVERADYKPVLHYSKNLFYKMGEPVKPSEK